MFPFGRDSTGAKSVLQYLHDNHNYQTRITDGGKYPKNTFRSSLDVTSLQMDQRVFDKDRITFTIYSF